MGISVTNAELLGAQPFVHALARLSLEGITIPEKARIKYFYTTKLLKAFMSCIDDYDQAYRQIITEPKNVVMDKDGKPQELTPAGVEERNALLDLEITIDAQPLDLPYLVYAQDTIQVTYFDKDGKPRTVNETLSAVIAALEKFVRVLDPGDF